MKLRYNYRLNPTPTQIELLKQAGGTTRFLWNYFLRKNIDEYATSKEYTGIGKFVFYHDMRKQLPELKKQLPWLKNTYSQTLQAVLLDLDGALKFKKHRRGFPKFKSKYAKRDSFRYIQNTKIEDNKYLVLPKIGRIRIKLHRELPKYSSITIYQEGEHWVASFVVEKQEAPKQQIERAIGIDMNSELFAVSDGLFISNPRFLKQKQTQVRGLQRALSRKQKGSSGREKARDRLARVMSQIWKRRHNFLHQVSSGITKPGVLVCAETLKIEEMKKNHLAAKAIGDAGWSSLFSLLKYKSELKGGDFHQINQWLPSSKACNACGHKKERLSLGEREYRCDECGYAAHRDLNAACNIRDWGQQEFVLRYGDVFAGRQELPPTPLDVIADVITFSGDQSVITEKEEATFL